MSPQADEPRFKLTFTVPPSSLEACKSAIFAKGAGSYPGGKYSLVCHETHGTSQFMPNEGATPNIGKAGDLERVQEVRVEVLCVGRDVMQGAVVALRHSHPYEEVAFDVVRLEDV